MLHAAQIAVVVPAYNEAAHIGRMLRTIPAYVDRVWVVDDGSTDATADVVRAVGDPRVMLVQHAENRGVGAALKTGYRLAFEAGADVVAVMAGDGQMHPDDLERLVLPVVRGEADYTKGDRLSHPQVRQRMPRMRYLGNHLLSALTRCAVGLPLRDSQCGYTALGRHALDARQLDAVWDGYGYPNDLLGWLHLAGSRVRDVVVQPVYGHERSGIGFRHALFVIPFVLFRVALRRVERALSGVPALPAASQAEPD